VIVSSEELQFAFGRSRLLARGQLTCAARLRTSCVSVKVKLKSADSLGVELVASEADHYV
jgi:hypothetical protein